MKAVRAHLVAVAAALAALGGLAPAASAERLLVVLTSDAAPYREAQKAATAALAARGHSVQTALLADVRASSGALNGIDGALAVGTEAAVHLSTALPQPATLVYCMVTDPAAAGLTGGRAAGGVRLDADPSASLTLLREALPDARRIGLLYRSDVPASRAAMESAQAAVASAPGGLSLAPAAINEHASPAKAIESLLGAGIDAVWTLPDATVYDPATVKALLLGALRRKTPVFGYSEAFVRSGAFAGVGVEPREQGAAAADLTVAALERARIPLAPPPEQPAAQGSEGAPAREAAPSPSQGPTPAQPSAPAGSGPAPEPPRPPRLRLIVNRLVAEQLGRAVPARAIAGAKVLDAR